MPPSGGKKRQSAAERSAHGQAPQGCVPLRTHDGERAAGWTASRASGLSISSLIEAAWMSYRYVHENPDIRELYTEINRIGNNINQIARSVNAGIATPEDARQALFLLRQVHELMERIVDK
jgi:hypothetical protein